MYNSELKSHIYNKMHIKHVEPDEASSVPQIFVRMEILMLPVTTSLEGTFISTLSHIMFIISIKIDGKIYQFSHIFPFWVLHDPKPGLRRTCRTSF